MKYFLRAERKFIPAVLAVATLLIAIPITAQGQSLALTPWRWGNLLVLRSTSQGYLGVQITDVDPASIQTLRLKEGRGALITRIDHDAPACKIGLKINDVILQLNGQTIVGSLHLRNLLREIPAGHKVSLVISRDGTQMTFNAQLADRRMIEKNIRDQVGSPGDVQGSDLVTGTTLPPGTEAHSISVFHWWSSSSTLNVGATVELLTAQMADYLGVSGGLIVKSVVHKSEAAAAGFKRHDIILKVGNAAINTYADWERSLQANQDKPVPVTVLRDNKQLTLNLQINSKGTSTKHTEGAHEPAAVFPSTAASFTR